MSTRYRDPDISFYSSDEYIKCLCADQSGKKINEVDKKAQENHIVCVDREDNHR